MNYERIYNSLIERRRLERPDGYVERHHIVPRSLGGSNAKANLVDLTAREHFVAHLLLARIHGGPMWVAIIRMKNRQVGPGYCNSRLYEEAKRKWGAWASEHYRGKRRTTQQINASANAIRGRKRTEETKRKISDAQKGERGHMFGKRVSEDARAKISAAMSKRRLSDEHRRRIAEAHKASNLSEETLAKMRASAKERFAKLPHPALGRKRPDLAERNRARAAAARAAKNV